MYIFCISLLPLLLTLYIISAKDKATLFVALVGAIQAVIFCTIKAYFTSSYRIASSSFLANFLHYYFFQIFLPIAIVYILFFIFSNEGIFFKIESYFPLVCAFFAIYMPYKILQGSVAKYSFYELFLKPTLYASLCAFSSVCIKYILLGIVNRTADKIFWTLLFFLSLAVPALIETLWFLKSPFFIYFIPLVLYEALAIVGFMNAQKESAPSLSVFLPI